MQDLSSQPRFLVLPRMIDTLHSVLVVLSVVLISDMILSRPESEEYWHKQISWYVELGLLVSFM